MFRKTSGCRQPHSKRLLYSIYETYPYSSVGLRQDKGACWFKRITSLVDLPLLAGPSGNNGASRDTSQWVDALKRPIAQH